MGGKEWTQIQSCAFKINRSGLRGAVSSRKFINIRRAPGDFSSDVSDKSKLFYSSISFSGFLLQIWEGRTGTHTWTVCVLVCVCRVICELLLNVVFLLSSLSPCEYSKIIISAAFCKTNKFVSKWNFWWLNSADHSTSRRFRRNDRISTWGDPLLGSTSLNTLGVTHTERALFW